MANALMRHCPACREYTLKDVCPRCGGKAVQNTPAKFSPEDTYGSYRRDLKRLDAKKGKPPA
jgi:H/ACA ribonucleoprotein complex subunit 3